MGKRHAKRTANEVSDEKHILAFPDHPPPSQSIAGVESGQILADFPNHLVLAEVMERFVRPLGENTGGWPEADIVQELLEHRTHLHCPMPRKTRDQISKKDLETKKEWLTRWLKARKARVWTLRRKLARMTAKGAGDSSEAIRAGKGTQALRGLPIVDDPGDPIVSTSPSTTAGTYLGSSAEVLAMNAVQKFDYEAYEAGKAAQRAYDNRQVYEAASGDKSGATDEAISVWIERERRY